MRNKFSFEHVTEHVVGIPRKCHIFISANLLQICKLKSPVGTVQYSPTQLTGTSSDLAQLRRRNSSRHLGLSKFDCIYVGPSDHYACPQSGCKPTFLPPPSSVAWWEALDKWTAFRCLLYELVRSLGGGGALSSPLPAASTSNKCGMRARERGSPKYGK